VEKFKEISTAYEVYIDIGIYRYRYRYTIYEVYIDIDVYIRWRFKKKRPTAYEVYRRGIYRCVCVVCVCMCVCVCICRWKFLKKKNSESRGHTHQALRTTLPTKKYIVGLFCLYSRSLLPLNPEDSVIRPCVPHFQPRNI